MASTEITTSHALAVRQYDDQAYREYEEKLVLKPYMGLSGESLIHVKENLQKSKGDQIIIPLVDALGGAGVSGESTLEGNEEAMVFRDYSVTITEYANAVRFNGSLTTRRTAFDIKDEAKPALTSWLAQKQQIQAFTALGSFNGVSYGSATEVQKDAFLLANADRFLFGAAVANNVASDHSAALLTVDATNDVLAIPQITLAKRLAQLSDPKIRPFKMQNGEEIFVMFVHPLCARDLKNSDAWKNAQMYARNRGDSNNLFTGEIGMYDGVVIVESNQVPLISAVGASSINVAQNFLCGAQALVMAQGGYLDRGGAPVVLQEEMFDYKRQWGCAIMSQYEIKKPIFNSKQHGVVTVYSAAVAD
jgi:N4-gp56 family major capsid protein